MSPALSTLFWPWGERGPERRYFPGLVGPTGARNTAIPIFPELPGFRLARGGRGARAKQSSNCIGKNR
eukprot:5347143-Lingulodinium_polyedra.AAC.1